MKQVQITVPYEKTETVFDFLIDVLDIKNVLRFTSDNAHILQFRIPDGAISDTMEGLKSRGVGVEFGFIDILDLKASLPREAEESKEKNMQREATLAVEEIYENVKKQASLSFDFIAFVVFAAVMAGFGLIQNNITIIVASMLLSPLMGPMLGVALGHVVGDNQLFIKGTRNELIALGFSFAVGAIMAIMMPVLYNGTGTFMSLVESEWGTGINPPLIVTEITRRGAIFSGLDIGIAIFSGAAIAVSVTKGDMSSLVGVAISAALMPPAVNVGMMITLGLIHGSIIGIQIGLGSLLLLAMNIILIDISAIIMFRIKKLGIIEDKSATWNAVTQFRQRKSESLYHTSTTTETPAAFTPAPTSETTSDKASRVENGKESNGEG
ncbi:MAG: TIGR00341 family protein [Candidatus Thorarchaeota archaeon]|nr:TIGR00341 family protein [Candidatus Thorarchaeota archaeon]